MEGVLCNRYHWSWGQIRISQKTGGHCLILSQIDPDLARLPRVLCTAATEIVGDAATVTHLDHLGGHVLRKPFAIEELLRVLREALAARSRTQRVDAAEVSIPS